MTYRTDRTDRKDRTDRADRTERTDRTDRTDRRDRTDRTDSKDKRQDRQDRPQRQDRQDRQHRQDRQDRQYRQDRQTQSGYVGSLHTILVLHVFFKLETSPILGRNKSILCLSASNSLAGAGCSQRYYKFMLRVLPLRFNSLNVCKENFVFTARKSFGVCTNGVEW